nr:zinc finger, CCHC-type [Tanacetum cinerariifolium]
MAGTKFDIKNFDGKNDFTLWQELQKITEAKGSGRVLIVRGQSHRKEAADSGFVRNEDQISGSRVDGYDNADVMMAMSVEELLDQNMDSGSSYYITYKRGKVQVQMRDGSSFVLDNVSYVLELRQNLISLGTLKKDGFTVKMQSGKIKVIKGSLVSGVAKHLGVAVIQQQNALVKEMNMTLLAKEDHTFEVEPHGNVDHIVGLQELQTQDLIYYHTTRDKEQHSAWELFNYREDSNEIAFAVAAVDKIYAHESLKFNNIVVCEAEIWVIMGLLVKAKGNILGLEIIKDQNGITLRVSQSRFYNVKLVQTLLEGHFILSLKGSLSRDYDVEKNDFNYAMGRSIIVMGRSITSGLYDIYGGCKRGYWAKRTRNRVRIRAKDSSGYCYSSLPKAIPDP